MSPEPRIPIENIYYMFCYAWDRFEVARSLPVGGIESPDLPNLLARVLLAGTSALLRRGLDRSYHDCSEEIATVRGHIELGATLCLRARNVRRLQCEFDELTHDVLHNRIVKASLMRLSRAPTLEGELAHELRALARRLADVSDIWLERSAFARVQLHRNNAYYELLIRVCELAFDCLLPSPAGDGFSFHDILRDERKMARVFEEFVRNFFHAHLQGFSVEPLSIRWDAVPFTVEGPGRLPNMRVDIFLNSPERKIIIDTKYYADAFQSFHGSESFRSENLYQLFSYLKNAAGADAALSTAEGVLLYPRVQHTIDARFNVQGHAIKIATIDLSRPWPEIHARLLQLVVKA
jgi:5-methylcytosine-specific restriction enzyme subunit McrC